MKKSLICTIIIALLSVSIFSFLMTGCSEQTEEEVFIGDLKLKLYEKDSDSELSPFYQLYVGKEYTCKVSFVVQSRTALKSDNKITLQLDTPVELVNQIVYCEENGKAIESISPMMEVYKDKEDKRYLIPISAPVNANETKEIVLSFNFRMMTAGHCSLIYDIVSEDVTLRYDVALNKEDNNNLQLGAGMGLEFVKSKLSAPVLQAYVEGSSELVWKHVENADYYVISVNGNDSYGGSFIRKDADNVKPGSTIVFSIADDGFSGAFKDVCSVTVFAHDSQGNFIPSDASNTIEFVYND